MGKVINPVISHSSEELLPILVSTRCLRLVVGSTNISPRLPNSPVWLEDDQVADQDDNGCENQDELWIPAFMNPRTLAWTYLAAKMKNHLLARRALLHLVE